MKIIQLDQKSQDWLDWRRTGVGASDAPIILGLSPYKKPHTLWEEKCGIKQPRPFSAFLEERAKKVEDAARATLELESGHSYPPLCAEDENFPWLHVSFDGYCEEIKMIMEAKYVGMGKQFGKIPASHWVQMQYQMFIAHTDKCIYMRSNDGVNFPSILVVSDARYQSMMMEEIHKFWKAVMDTKEVPNERRPAGWKSKVELPEGVGYDTV